MASYIGVDGCKRGWFAVWLADGQLCGKIYANAAALWAEHADAERLMIDMPIGLKDEAPRQLESAVRRHLGSRKSSVFPVPCFSAAYASSYEAASELNREKIGKGLSKQAWFICPKICDLDQLLRSDPEAQRIFGECHPELAFAYLNGAPLSEPKKSKQGQRHRRELVQRCLPNSDVFIDHMLRSYPRKDLLVDDCLDALALAITAATAIPMDADDEVGVGGIPIRMWVPDC